MIHTLNHSQQRFLDLIFQQHNLQSARYETRDWNRFYRAVFHYSQSTAQVLWPDCTHVEKVEGHKKVQ
jgi:hypothetical protein